MKRLSIVVVLAALTSIGCERDPASKVKIVARPPAAPPVTLPGQSGSVVLYGPNGQVTVDTAPPKVNTAASINAPPFKPELCTLQPDNAGSSTFTVKGPCPIQQTSNVKCRAVADDFYTTFLRKGPGEATAAIYLNVEYFQGPGTYKGGQMFLTVQNGEAYYHWSNDSVETIVAPGYKYVDIPTQHLNAEPPNKGTATVGGRLWCESVATQ